MTPQVTGEFLVARDGTRLPLRHWEAEGERTRAVSAAWHGMSDYSNAFDMPGKGWAKKARGGASGFFRGPPPALCGVPIRSLHA